MPRIGNASGVQASVENIATSAVRRGAVLVASATINAGNSTGSPTAANRGAGYRRQCFSDRLISAHCSLSPAKTGDLSLSSPNTALNSSSNRDNRKNQCSARGADHIPVTLECRRRLPLKELVGNQIECRPAAISHCQTIYSAHDVEQTIIEFQE